MMEFGLTVIAIIGLTVIGWVVLSKLDPMGGKDYSGVSKKTKLRIVGGLVLLFNLWLIGQYNLQGIPVLLLTFGFAIGYEFLVVRPMSKVGTRQATNDSPRSARTEELGVTKTSPTPILPKKVESTAPIASKPQTVVDEDPIYTAIAKELETGVADKGLWIRLFAECGGDEKQTKVLYIKQRADRLISAERLRLEQAARQRAAEAEEHLRLQKEARERAAETGEQLRLEQAARKRAAETEERLRLEQAARKRAAETEERLRLEQAARERTAEIERTEKLRPPASDAQQMKEYGISFDGERYTYGEYKYDKLADAINYAKLQKKRSTHQST